ncbi:MAG TPA: response regulator [Thermoanaerobaculia bacterium]|nr:response regulator [Thermoanaerobaculia bacterium]
MDPQRRGSRRQGVNLTKLFAKQYFGLNVGPFLAGAHSGSTEEQRTLSQSHGILVVEDDHAIRHLVRMVLQREGYRIEEASDGVEAVVKMGLVEYDVIILDLMMPNLDGFSFMTTMSEHDESRLKKIIITSAASPALINERMRGTPFDLLPKPFDIRDLISRVRACITAQAT